MRNVLKGFGVLALVTTIAACAQQEEPVQMTEEPIYGKDGSIIGMRPVVISPDMTEDDFESIDDTAATAAGAPSDVDDGDSDG